VLATLVSSGACRKETASAPASTASPAASPGPDVWAVVNGKPITREEVEKYYRTGLAANSQRQPSDDESLGLKLNIVEELINNQILLERAKALGLEPTEAEVQAKVAEVKGQSTDEEMAKQLSARGLTVDDLKSDLRRQLTLQKVIDREITSKISITDQDLRDFYDRNRAQFNVPEPHYRIAQIVVTSRKEPGPVNRRHDDAGSPDEARNKIAMIVNQLKGGADFAQLAQDLSEDPSAANGGDVGYQPESVLKQDPRLAQTFLKLAPGGMTDVLPDQSGFRILKMIAREPAGERAFGDPQVQQSIRAAVRNNKEQVLRNAYLATVRDEAKVVNYLARQVVESSGKMPATPPAAEPAKK
jgi:peptidyl-prolyl cis-trans isomerase SurA